MICMASDENLARLRPLDLGVSGGTVMVRG
jgi:hypothetical protein